MFILLLGVNKVNKKVVISGYYGFGNFGDEAILSVLVNHLKKLGCEIVVLSSNPRTTSMNYMVNAIKSFNFYQVSGIIKQSDVLISGGGSLLQDVTSLKSLLYYLWVIFTALRYKKKVIIFAQGIGPVNNRIAQFITAKILRNCHYVSVRDQKSYELTQKWKVNSELLCDPIFSIATPIASKKGIMGVQLRDFPTLNDNLLNKLARKIVKDFYDKDIEIYSLQDNIDLAVCQRFQNIIKSMNSGINCKIIHGLSIPEVIAKISNLEYMIGMRFHAIVTSLKLGVKSIGINYDIKVEKLANEAGIPLISMEASEDFDIVFDELKLLNENNLRDFANAKIFDWTNFDKSLV